MLTPGSKKWLRGSEQPSLPLIFRPAILGRIKPMYKINIEKSAGKIELPFLQRISRRFMKEKQLWMVCIPMIVFVLIFAYYPMYGVLVSFMDYIPGAPIIGSKWVGLKYFIEFFNSPDLEMIMRNTLAISGLNILFGFPAPIILALLLNELQNRHFKKVVQTVSYLPNFISWVVAASLIFTLFGSEGVINRLIQDMGLTEEPVGFLSTGKYFWWLITMANIWKGVGWSAIIYLSAMAGIDRELYQAGAVDGLGRFGMVWHITLPGISTTILLLWILRIGGILNAGFDQQLLIGNAMTREYWEVIDTYAYRYGIQLGRYSYATAVGLFKSVISILLIFVTNRASKKLAGASIF